MSSRFLAALLVLCGWCGGCATLGGKGQHLEKLLNSMAQPGQDSSKNEPELTELCKSDVDVACALLGRTVGLKQSVAITQGFTNSSESWLNALVPKGAELRYVVLRQNKPLQVVRPRVSKRDFSDWQVDLVHLSELKPHEKYELWVMDERGRLWDRRGFKSLDLRAKKPRLALASCMDDSFTEAQGPAWKKLIGRQPDLILFLGDNVYADKHVQDNIVTAETLWKRYVDTRNLLSIFRANDLIPILATWDDHDYGVNDGGRDFALKDQSRDIFLTFFPRPEAAKEWESGPGVSALLTAFGQRFFLLDTRSFRTTNNQPQVDQSHFGEAQTQWLLHRLKSLREPAWLISGDQFFGGYHHFESFEGSHQKDFTRFRQSLKSVRVPFLFVSGDRHMTEIMKLSKADVGQVTYELTSSPLHAVTYPNSLARNPNPRRLKAAAGPMNFMDLEPNVKNGELQVKVRSWGVKEGLLFEKELNMGGKK